MPKVEVQLAAMLARARGQILLANVAMICQEDGEMRSSAMTKEHAYPTNELVLHGPAGLGQLRVDIEAFFEFSFWLAEELEDFVDRSQRKYPRGQTMPDARVARGARVS